MLNHHNRHSVGRDLRRSASRSIFARRCFTGKARWTCVFRNGSSRSYSFFRFAVPDFCSPNGNRVPRRQSRAARKKRRNRNLPHRSITSSTRSMPHTNSSKPSFRPTGKKSPGSRRSSAKTELPTATLEFQSPSLLPTERRYQLGLDVASYIHLQGPLHLPRLNIPHMPRARSRGRRTVSELLIFQMRKSQVSYSFMSLNLAVLPKSSPM